MNVLILTNSNPYVNAGVVASYLYNGFKDKGYSTKLVVKQYGRYPDEKIICIDRKKSVIISKYSNKIKKMISKHLNIKKSKPTNEDYTIHNYNLTKQYYDTKEILKIIDFNPNVIIYLFPQNFLNAKNLYELNYLTKAPIFWYLMDSAALTGGCHFFWDCKGYITGCGQCPGMNSQDKNDQSAINLKFKNFYLNKTEIHIISGTDRLFKQSMDSLLYKNKPIHKISLPIDHEIFKPTLKESLRTKLNLPKQKNILFFGAGSLKSKRKGMRYMVDALRIIYNQRKDLDILLLIAGNDFEYIKDDLLFDFKYLGVLENNTQLASAYQVSDVFVSPSIEDAGPMMINQSIMCGTPVVSFAMGVAFDLVLPEKTGYVAELRNSIDLAKGIIEMLSLDNKEKQIIANNCRALALKELTQDVFVNKFENIINNI